MATIRVGDIFKIQVNIREGKNVYGIESYLVYPHSDIEILQEGGKPVIVKGDFMGENSAVKPNLKQADEFGVGVLEVLHSLKGAEPENSGDGLLFSLKAKALRAGMHTLQWHSKSTVFDKDLEPQLNKFENHMLKIISPEQNNDPEVNVIYITVTAEGD